MKNIMFYSDRVKAVFDNNPDNILAFEQLALDASKRKYTQYSAEETNQMIRCQLTSILGVDFADKNVTQTERRQAWRAHGIEVNSIVENILIDRMNSGWNPSNAAFMNLVEDKNIALGDENEFFVESKGLLTVSKWAGNHHDVVRQKVTPGRSFRVDTSTYTIKVYTDYVLFMTGKIDFAGLIDRMYQSMEQFRYSSLFEAFKGMDTVLPTDMILTTAITTATTTDIIAHIDLVKSVAGVSEVLLTGTTGAINKLQATVPYDIYSESMKEELNKTGKIGYWMGNECLALERVNIPGTRQSVFDSSDDNKILILPKSATFKPIKRVNEGDVEYVERGREGELQDRTVEGQLNFWEGIGVVVDELFGEIIATS